MEKEIYRGTSIDPVCKSSTDTLRRVQRTTNVLAQSFRDLAETLRWGESTRTMQQRYAESDARSHERRPATRQPLSAPVLIITVLAWVALIVYGIVEVV